jgi:hypothetical protein
MESPEAGICFHSAVYSIFLGDFPHEECCTQFKVFEDEPTKSQGAEL